MNKIYRFYEDCGRMGRLDGTFVSTDEKIKAMLGKTAYFGEALGKHSEISVELAESNFTVLTDDQAFIDKAVEYGLLPNGFSPANYMEEEA